MKLILILAFCVTQIHARYCLEQNRSGHDTQLNNNVDYLKSSSNDSGQSHLLDLNDNNAAKSQQVLFWDTFVDTFVPYFWSIFESIPEGMFIIPLNVLDNKSEEKLKWQRERYESAKRKTTEKRKKMYYLPIRYESI